MARSFLYNLQKNDMKFISTKAHGAFDYIIGTLLLFAPWIFDFANYETAQSIPVVVGISVIVYSIFTGYEFGSVAIFAMRSHLTFDFIGGLYLAASPWLYDFADYVYIPHLVFGIIMMGTSLCSDTQCQSVRSVIQAN